ncbi:serine hydrolase domain-containing protein [Roseateles chitosanitabidus]|uniref:serine hydrolase domain-containing protein n=1 Tax=Roseateles chitosanitabidus TaxID=65048 RepID=UPI000831D081|nr:serine hydrolase domain-containing protein [Roseateles chitosanitabidus]
MVFALVLGIAVVATILLSACGSGDDPRADPSTGRAAVLAIVQRAASEAVAGGLVGVAVDHLGPDRTDAVVAGVRRAGAGDAIRATDFFQIGSTTKAMTAAVAARLVERGVIAWTTTLAEALPELAEGMLPAYRGVTLEQLLDHRGGVAAFTDPSDGERFFSAVADAGIATPDTPAARARIFAAWLLAQEPPKGVTPGRDFLYSNAGYALVAMMLEARAGQPFIALFEVELAKPLGLAVAWVRQDATLTEAPLGHDGVRGKIAAIAPLDVGMAAWLAVLAPSGGGLALPPESYASWVRWHMKALQGQATPLPGGYLQRLRGLKAGEYALGWQGDDIEGRAVLAHTGEDRGYSSLVILDRQGRSASFAFTNTEAQGEDWVMAALTQRLVDMERALQPK